MYIANDIFVRYSTDFYNIKGIILKLMIQNGDLRQIMVIPTFGQ